MDKKKVMLGDGEEYTLAPFHVGDFIEIEKKYGSISLQQDKLEPVLFWFWLAIRKHHDGLTLEELYKKITSRFISEGGMAKIFETMADLNGWVESKNEGSPVEVSVLKK